MSLRVVFDTNVLVSAIGWGGTPGRCLDAALKGRLRALSCVEIMHELGGKLAVILGFTDDQVEVAIGSLASFFEFVAISGEMRGTQADPGDDKVIECAVVGRASHIVTGDRKHLLPLERFGGVEIVSPAALIAIIQRDRA